MDISKQLHTYEVEYHVLQDEMVEGGPLAEDSERLEKLEKTNVQLKRQNMELLEKLQVWCGRKHSEGHLVVFCRVREQGKDLVLMLSTVQVRAQPVGVCFRSALFTFSLCCAPLWSFCFCCVMPKIARRWH